MIKVNSILQFNLSDMSFLLKGVVRHYPSAESLSYLLIPSINILLGIGWAFGAV
jgi:hypothetical protein